MTLFRCAATPSPASDENGSGEDEEYEEEQDDDAGSKEGDEDDKEEGDEDDEEEGEEEDEGGEEDDDDDGDDGEEERANMAASHGAADARRKMKKMRGASQAEHISRQVHPFIVGKFSRTNCVSLCSDSSLLYRVLEARLLARSIMRASALASADSDLLFDGILSLSLLTDPKIEMKTRLRGSARRPGPAGLTRPILRTN